MIVKKVGILMMRAQPLHSGHKELIRKAYKQCQKLLILVGSANSARTILNPFTYLERESTICRFIDFEFSSKSNIMVLPVNDYKYSDSQWLSDVATIVNDFTSPDDEVVLFGFMKDGNDYLNWFPQYKYENIESQYDIAATGIRENWFKTQRHNFAPEVLADWDCFQKEKATFANYPYPACLNVACSDLLLECSGHIMLVLRKHAPGMGTWALPGGHKNSNETHVDCAFREGYEETNVRVPEKILRASIVQTKLYDAPNRSLGLTRTSVTVHVKISPNADGTLPRISPADDAMDVQWVPTQKAVNDIDMYDDHKDIISDLTGVVALPAHKNPRFMVEVGRSVFSTQA